MKVAYKILYNLIVYFIIFQSNCFAEINSTIYYSNVSKNSVFDNIFKSTYSLHAKGIIYNSENYINQSVQNNQQYNHYINKFTVKLSNFELLDCKFNIYDKSALANALSDHEMFASLEKAWEASCKIPNGIEFGSYQLQVDIQFDSGKKLTVANPYFLYNNSNSSIFISPGVAAIFLIILIFKFNLPKIINKIILIILPVTLIISYIVNNIYIYYSSIFWILIGLFLFYIRHSSIIHSFDFEKINNKCKIFILFIVFVISIICILPMSMSPYYNTPLKQNGSFISHSEQYSHMAQSILKGKLYIDYGKIDENLIKMDNPYDPVKRKQYNIEGGFDHAFYKGKYYMYFGVVPVFLIFIPYQLITGEPLGSYHATQIFVVLSISCFFLLFNLLTKYFFSKISIGIYISLSTVFSVISIWYCIDAPALYCTSISAGICFEMWSIYMFTRSMLIEMSDKQRINTVFSGSLFGALAFGCRPPLALTNIIIFPVLLNFISKYNIISFHSYINIIKKIFILILPYIIIITLLMLYNYLRFENPFEFGLSYMLTDIDFHNYSNYIKQNINIKMILMKLYNYYFEFSHFDKNFPFIGFNGVFLNFPILLSSFLLFNKKDVTFLYNKKYLYFVIFLLLATIIVSTFDIIAVASVRERYRLDIYFLFGILSYIAICTFFMKFNPSHQRLISFFIVLISFITLCYIFLLVIVPFDGNFTEVYPEINQRIYKVFTFGFGEMTTDISSNIMQ